jgi:hypothetical protein
VSSHTRKAGPRWPSTAPGTSSPLFVCRSAPPATGGCAGFAEKYPEPAWALEGAYRLGAPLAALLSADGVQILDVPAKLAARVRLLSHGHGRKSDEDDARPVAVAAATSATLRPVGSGRSAPARLPVS